MSLKDDLIAARALIDTPAKWTQKVLARTIGGNAIGPNQANAVCFCALGANQRVTREQDRLDAMTDALEAALPDDWPNKWIDEFNDHRTTTHEMVLAVYDKAIASC